MNLNLLVYFATSMVEIWFKNLLIHLQVDFSDTKRFPSSSNFVKSSLNFVIRFSSAPSPKTRISNAESSRIYGPIYQWNMSHHSWYTFDFPMQNARANIYSLSTGKFARGGRGVSSLSRGYQLAGGKVLFWSKLR